MGTRGREMVGPKVDQVIDMLKEAFADEWLAHYQYWIGAKVAQGPMRGAVAAELLEHSEEEREHAEKLAERIIQLGGTLPLQPQDWYALSGCGYEVPEDPSVLALLKQNVEGEQCAIKAYRKLLAFTQDIDPITYALVLEILTDEVEHEEDLQAFVTDIELMRRV